MAVATPTAVVASPSRSRPRRWPWRRGAAWCRRPSPPSSAPSSRRGSHRPRRCARTWSAAPRARRPWAAPVPRGPVQVRIRRPTTGWFAASRTRTVNRAGSPARIDASANDAVSFGDPRRLLARRERARRRRRLPARAHGARLELPAPRRLVVARDGHARRRRPGRVGEHRDRVPRVAAFEQADLHRLPRHRLAGRRARHHHPRRDRAPRHHARIDHVDGDLGGEPAMNLHRSRPLVARRIARRRGAADPARPRRGWPRRGAPARRRPSSPAPEEARR